MIMEDKAFHELIHVIRDQSVILDFDLAKLYGTEVKKLMQQVKRNLNKFPDDFMFQFTQEDMNSLRSQNVTTNYNTMSRFLPYAFTEQGVYMVATILKNDIATQQSIFIMRSFKAMKHYLKENQTLLNNEDLLKLSNQLMRQDNRIQSIENIMATKTDIEKIMENFLDESKIKEIVILNGQKFDAIEAYIKIYQQAKHSIYIIDNYININTLGLLKHKRKDVNIIIFTENKGIDKVTPLEVKKFNEQYPYLTLKYISHIHDRFIVIDYGKVTEQMYLCGASSKDAGQRISTIIQMYEVGIMHTIIDSFIC